MRVIEPHVAMPISPCITIHAAASTESSLEFLLVGTAVLLPIILAYTAHAYWVFRGKTVRGAGYH